MGKVLYFAGGLLFGGFTGFASAKYLLKEKYRRKSDEDIASVKETYRKVLSEMKADEPVEAAEEKRAEPVVLSAARVNADRAREKGDVSQYMHYAKMYGGEEKQIGKTSPTIITPEEFGEKEGYEQVSLTWYADEVLADMDDHRLDDAEIEQKVGHDAMEHFGEYENDSVFIRNDELKCDYEILMDHRKYADVLEDKPYLNE